MILVDTSVWVDHFRRRNDDLSILLRDGQVACHDFVIGELACGNLRNRNMVLQLLSEIARAEIASHVEVLLLLEERKLTGKGIGWIDAHLLASCLISHLRLWTRDAALANAAALLGCHFSAGR
ncbi:MAG: type II toxin-antitoxin system VapC family toxin [Deltaproteobacteria bacterium]|nr:type II toxin-antitoxin system VapC family toxin [Deltaproteobacteria bacterium]